MGIWKRKKRADPAQEPEVDAAILRAWQKFPLHSQSGNL